MTDGGTTQVARRRVFYVPGYDPHPPRRYRELYRTESRSQAEISNYAIDQRSEPGTPGWFVEAEIEGAHVQSQIDVLVWNDLVQGSMATGIAGTYLALLRTAWIYISTGTLGRLSRLAKGPVIAALYPVVLLILQLLVAILVAFGLVWLLDLGLSAFLGQVLGPLVGGLVSWLLKAGAFGGSFLGLMRWFRAQDNRVYAHYLMLDYAYTASLRGAYPQEIEARLSEFRARVEAALNDDVDEVLIVGHSSGAWMAVSLAADLLQSGAAREGGPAVSLLTLGQVIPMVSFLPDARRLRRDLAFLSSSDDIAWLDVSAPGDGCSFALADPVAVSGVAPETGRKWPIVISAAFSQTLSPERFATLKRRYFRLHFQYLCAFDRPSDYDYFKITAGPLTLADRFRGRHSSKSRIDTPASRYTSTTTVEAT